MVTNEQILEALRDVEDPEVHKSIVELDMVRNIELSGSTVSLEVVLTIRGCPLRNVIEEAVNERLLKLPGIEHVNLTIGSMTEAERRQFTEKLKGTPDVQTTPPLLQPDSTVLTIAIASGKGGVGKSTITANFARALANQGLKVGIVDADIYGFSIPGIFGVKEKRPTVIDDLIMPIEVHGVKLISMHFFVPDNNPVVWRGPMLGKMLRNFFGSVHWGDLDVLLLDLPPGTGDVALDVHTMLPRSKEIIVTTPQTDAAEVAVRAGLMGMRTNHEILGVVENMAFYQCGSCGEKAFIFGRGGGKRVAEELRTDVIAEVPIAEMADKKSLFETGTPQYDAFEQMAKTVIERAGLLSVSNS